MNNFLGVGGYGEITCSGMKVFGLSRFLPKVWIGSPSPRRVWFRWLGGATLRNWQGLGKAQKNNIVPEVLDIRVQMHGNPLDVGRLHIL